MSSRSTKKSAASLVDSPDEQADEALNEVTPDPLEEDTASEPEASVVDGEAVVTDSNLGDRSTAPLDLQVESTTAAPAGELSENNGPESDADTLAQQLQHLVQSVSVVEELSRRARDIATSDLAMYDALLTSQQQYAGGLEQACAIRDQAREVRERAFGQEARHAAEPLVADAERVVLAFTELSTAWQQRASSFVEHHPDIELLLVERHAQEEQTRQAELGAARCRRLQALVATSEDAIRQGLFHECRRVLEHVEREFPEETATIDQLRLKLEQRDRAEKDKAARQALTDCAERQARGDFEGAVNVLEQVDVHGLSVDVSQDVFGRWSDACSRLAQTAAATLLRFAPTQGRGLILYADPAYPNGLIVFSSLGMGPGFAQGKVVTDIAVLRRARPFREAAALPVTSWAGLAATSLPATPAAAPVRH